MDFKRFFTDAYGYGPFRWQEILAERVESEGRWPQVIDLPTASGKTAVIDVAVWAMARDAQRDPAQRTAPRRLWFVVDRRLVVDEAYRRAVALQDKLNQATTGPLADVAAALRTLRDGPDAAGKVAGSYPLRAARLRGGLVPDRRWYESIAQPAVITSTVDQFGSRLLFRPYGEGTLSAPIHAALAGQDSLLVIDEAHCAVPLTQTAEAVRAYQGGGVATSAHATQHVGRALQTVVMSATPPPDLTDRFPRPAERAEALNHTELRRRGSAAKPIELVVAAKPGKPKKGEPRPRSVLTAEARTQVAAAVKAGKQRIAVMVNRVDAAVSIEQALRKDLGSIADVRLLTGRMRPIDRADLLDGLRDVLGAKKDRLTMPTPDGRLVIICTTQCLEVGADWSFDALITECASIDALRQRFGRLNRLGDDVAVYAAVLAWKPEVPAIDKLDDGKPVDPIYGNAAARTWHWLNEQHAESPMNFGIDALEGRLPGDLEDFLAPVKNAVVLLPAHLDTWCQSGGSGAVAPDVAPFLHGPDSAHDEVHVVFRDDLARADDPMASGDLVAAVNLCPPLPGERLPVRLSRLRSWLRDGGRVDGGADVEGVVIDESAGREEGRGRERGAARPFVVVRPGQRTDAQALSNPSRIRAGDTVVVAAGDAVPPALGAGRVRAGSADAYDAVLARAAGGQADRAERPLRPRLRLTPPWLDPRETFLRIARPDVDARAVFAPIRDWIAHPPEERDLEALPALFTDLANAFDPVAGPFADLLRNLSGPGEMQPHPAGGVVWIGPRPPSVEAYDDADPLADPGDGTSLAGRDQPLGDHVEQVVRAVERMATACGLPTALSEGLRVAAEFHDAGKGDARFQGLLRRSRMPVAVNESERLAKSKRGPLPPKVERRLRMALRLPEKHWRHELLSARLLAESVVTDARLTDEEQRSLAVYVEQASHGHRALAPVAEDPAYAAVTAKGHTLERDAWCSTLPHHLASPELDRFWRGVRRYGWWGQAWLETFIRLADWHASARPKKASP